MNQSIKKKTATVVAQDKDISKYLTFLLAGKNYGVSILRVKEILEYDEVTPMPLLPDFISGVINIRGRAVPVIDLAARLNLQSADISRRTCIVVVELHTDTGLLIVGLIVDAVSKVLDFSAEDIERTPSLGASIRTDFISGMGKVEEKFVILLDIDKVLSMQDIQSLAEVEKVSA